MPIRHRHIDSAVVPPDGALGRIQFWTEIFIDAAKLSSAGKNRRGGPPHRIVVHIEDRGQQGGPFDHGKRTLTDTLPLRLRKETAEILGTRLSDLTGVGPVMHPADPRAVSQTGVVGGGTAERRPHLCSIHIPPVRRRRPGHIGIEHRLPLSAARRDVAAPAGNPAAVVVDVHGHRHHDLLQVVGAGDASGPLPRILQRGQQHRRKNRDDRNCNYDHLLNIQYGVY